MDVEQEGDSLSTSASKDAGASLVNQDNTMEQILDKEVFGLDPAEGAATTDDYEESEISVASGGTAPIKSSKKRKKNRRRKNKSRPVSDNENLSRVASNERIGTTSKDKPVVVTTYVCSSSELDKVRKLIGPMPQSVIDANPPSIPEEQDESQGEDNDSIEVVYHPPSTNAVENPEEDLSKIEDSGIEELSENPEVQMEEETAKILKSADFYSRCLDYEERTNLVQDEAPGGSNFQIAVENTRIEDSQARTQDTKLEGLALEENEVLNSPIIPVPEEIDTEVGCDSQAPSISIKSNKSDASQSSKGSHKKSCTSEASQKSKLSETSKASKKSDKLSVKSDSQKSHSSQGSKKAPSQKSVEFDKSNASECSETSNKNVQKEKSTGNSEKSVSSRRSSKNSQSNILKEDQMQMSPKSTSRNSKVSGSNSQSEKSEKSKGSRNSEKSAVLGRKKNETYNNSVEEDEDVETEDEVEEIEDISIRSTKTFQERYEPGENPLADSDTLAISSPVETAIENELSELPTETENSEKSKQSQHSSKKSQSSKSSKKSSKNKISMSKENIHNLPIEPEVIDKSEDAECTKKECNSAAETSSGANQRSELVLLDALGVLNSNDFPNLELPDSVECDSSSAHECSEDGHSRISTSKASITSMDSQKSAHSGCSKTSKKSTSSRKSDRLNKNDTAVQQQDQLEQNDESQASKASETSHSSKSKSSKKSKKSVGLENQIVGMESIQNEIGSSVPVDEDESQASQSLSIASAKSGLSKSSRRSNKSSASSKKSTVEIETVDRIPLEGVVEDDHSHKTSESVIRSAHLLHPKDLQPENDLSQKSDASHKSSASSKSASIKQSLSQASNNSQKSHSSAKSNTSRKSSRNVVAFSMEEENLQNNQPSEASEAFSVKSNGSKSSEKLANIADINVGEDADLIDLSIASACSNKSKSSKSSSKKSQLLEKVDVLNEEEFSEQLSVPSASSGSSAKSSKKSKSSKSKAESETSDKVSEKSQKSETSFKSMTSKKSGASVKDEQCLSENSKHSELSLKSQSSTKLELAKQLDDQDNLTASNKDSDHTPSSKSCKIMLDEAENLIQAKDYTGILTSVNNVPAEPCDQDPTESEEDSQSTELSEKTAVIYEEEETPMLVEGLQNTPKNFFPVNLETNMKQGNDVLQVSKTLSPKKINTEVDTEDEAEDIHDISIKSDENAFKSFSQCCNEMEEENLQNSISGRDENSQASNASSMAKESNSIKTDNIPEVSSEKGQGCEIYANVSASTKFQNNSVNVCKGSAFYCPATLEPYSDFTLDTKPEEFQDDANVDSIPDDLSEASVYSLPNELSNNSSASKKSNRSLDSKASNHSGLSKASNHSSASKVSKSSKRSISSRISKSCRISGPEIRHEQTEKLDDQEVTYEEIETDDAALQAQELLESELQSIPLVQHPSSATIWNVNDQLNKSSIDLIFKTKTISGNPSSFFTERSVEIESFDNVSNEMSMPESESQREDTSVRIEEADSAHIQHAVDKSWLSDADNEGREPSVAELGSSEIKLIKTDDIVLNDSMANNNYLQIHDPREEIEEIADKLQSCWYESQGVQQLDFNPRADPLAETELSLPEESTVVSSTTLQLPQVPFPSVENCEDSSLTPQSPQIYPSSLVRIALIKRDDPELVAFAQNAVRNVISQAQDKVISLENDLPYQSPEVSADESESECSKPISEPENNDQVQSSYFAEQEINPTEPEVMDENYQDSEPDPCSMSNYGYDNPEESTASFFDYDLQVPDQPPMRLVLSSNKATTANLSASSSNASIDSSTEALLRLPQVPNPSVANPDGLQNSTPQINLTGLSRWVGDMCSTKEMLDASCDGKQNLELEPKEILDKQSVSGAPSAISYSVNCSETYDFPDVPDEEIDVEDVEPIEADVSEQESDEEKQKPKEEKMLKELFRDDSSFIRDMEATSIPEPPHWVIDPKVIEDAITESDMTEDREPEKTSFIQSIFNCFGKKHRSKKSKEDCNVYMTQNQSQSQQQQKPSGRTSSRFRSFSLPKRKK